MQEMQMKQHQQQQQQRQLQAMEQLEAQFQLQQVRSLRQFCRAMESLAITYMFGGKLFLTVCECDFDR